MVQVIKNENESVGSLLRRFSKRMQRSGFLLRARARRSYTPPPSDYQKKREAIRRIEWQKSIDKLRKLGKNE